MTDDRWMNNVSPDGRSAGDRAIIRQMAEQAAAETRGRAEDARQSADQARQLQVAINGSAETIVRSHAASARAIAEFGAGLRDGIDGSTGKITSMMAASASRVVRALDQGFQAMAWGQDRLIALAERQVQGIERRKQTDAKADFESGMTAYGNRWWTDAYRDLSAAKNLFPYDPRPWFYLGRISLLVDGDAKMAKSFLSEAVRYGGPYPESRPLVTAALFDLAFVALLERDHGTIVKLVSAAVECDGQNPDVLIPAARFCLCAKSVTQSATFFIRACDAHPPSIFALWAPEMEPIRDTVLAWAQEKHELELAPSRVFRNELENLRKTVQLFWEPISRDSAWAAFERDYELLAGGFVDLRVNSRDVAERRAKLLSELIAQMRRSLGRSSPNACEALDQELNIESEFNAEIAKTKVSQREIVAEIAAAAIGMTQLKEKQSSVKQREFVTLPVAAFFLLLVPSHWSFLLLGAICVAATWAVVRNQYHDVSLLIGPAEAARADLESRLRECAAKLEILENQIRIPKARIDDLLRSLRQILERAEVLQGNAEQ